MTHAQAHDALAVFARVAREHGYKDNWAAYKDEANWAPAVREAYRAGIRAILAAVREGLEE